MRMELSGKGPKGFLLNDLRKGRSVCDSSPCRRDVARNEHPRASKRWERVVNTCKTRTYVMLFQIDMMSKNRITFRPQLSVSGAQRRFWAFLSPESRCLA